VAGSARAVATQADKAWYPRGNVSAMHPAKERFNVAEVARGEFRKFTSDVLGSSFLSIDLWYAQVSLGSSQ